MKLLHIFLSCLAFLIPLTSCQPLSAPAPGPASSCVLTPELTEGPYWLDDQLFRANITEGQALSITVLDITTCQPIPNAFVDIWHTNATGFYSGFNGNSAATAGGGAGSQGGVPGGSSSSGTNNETFLRGITLTDPSGVATFSTIQPGWYDGRTPHIHVKVHIPTTVSTSVPSEYASSHTVHTGQLFFSDAHMALVSAVSPYTDDSNQRLSLASDGLYNNPVTVLNISQVSDDSIAGGLVAKIDAIVNTAADYTPTSTASNVATTTPSSTTAMTTTVAAATPGATVAQSAPVSSVTATTSASTSTSAAIGGRSVQLAHGPLLLFMSLVALACF